MKKIIVFGLMFLFVAGVAFAKGNANSNVGCGLGSILWNEFDKSGPSQPIVIQVLEATTNGTFCSQTFGITTGTSNCNRPSQWVENEKLQIFVQKNMDSLAMDIAAGKGEYLDTLAVLMEIPAGEQTAFKLKLQQNFSAIYTSENVEMAQVIDNIATVIQ